MKWRKVKKQFKKNKKKYIGLHVQAMQNDGMAILMEISDVKIKPAGGKRMDYDFTAIPIKKVEIIKEDELNNRPKGFSVSFDMRIEKPTKALQNLLGI